MTEALPSQLLTFRKDELLRQIFRASQLEDGDKLSLLKFQWAHRYGLQTMPKILQSEKYSYVEVDSLKESLDDQQVFEDLGPADSESLGFNLNAEPSSGISKNPSQLDIAEQTERLPCDGLAALNKVEDDEKKKIFNAEVDFRSNDSRFISPPPRPSLNHLRRWLPDIKEELPKAS
ncbi:hypothetical protein [Prochlorococcus sp. MIT 1307]|uniref:hypothetical protein n=1 Tax=Prochlorococcus sp. MIT 1307 TaxID=3096219 RepID=UPI002A763170|nr:hypothetical protein [Prochlorococcus sp. MIT 1307]